MMQHLYPRDINAAQRLSLGNAVEVHHSSYDAAVLVLTLNGYDRW